MCGNLGVTVFGTDAGVTIITPDCSDTGRFLRHRPPSADVVLFDGQVLQDINGYYTPKNQSTSTETNRMLLRTRKHLPSG